MGARWLWTDRFSSQQADRHVFHRNWMSLNLAHMRLSSAVTTLLQQEGGVISREQCLTRGVSPSTLRTLVESGRWQRIHRGVYASTSGLLSDDAIIKAALLAVPKGILCNETALWSAERRRPLVKPVHLAVDPAEATRPQAGIRLHRLERLDKVGSDPPRTSYERALLEVVHKADCVRAVERVVCEVVGERLSTPYRITAELAKRPRQRWRTELSNMLAEVAVGAQSPLELLDLRNDRRHGLPVGERQVKQKSGGQGRWLDVLVSPPGRPELVVVKELDGRLGHEKVGRFRDMRRDNAVSVSGGRSLRFGWTDEHDAPCETAALQALLWRRLDVTVGSSCAAKGCDLAERVERLDHEYPLLAASS